MGQQLNPRTPVSPATFAAPFEAAWRAWARATNRVQAMCSFLSAIYTATGKLVCEPVYTDSHSELLISRESRSDTPPLYTAVCAT